MGGHGLNVQPQRCCFSAKALRADAQGVDFFQKLLLQRRVKRVGVRLINGPQKGVLGKEGHLVKGAADADTHDEWQVDDRRYLSEASMAKIYKTSDTGTVALETGDR